LKSHRHLGAIEICYLERGRQTYRINERDYNLVGGDVFVVRPGESHDTGGRPEDCGVLYWLILRIPTAQNPLVWLRGQDMSTIRNRLLNLPNRHFTGRPVLKQMFNRLFELHENPLDDLTPIAIKHQLLSSILEVIHCAYDGRLRQFSKEIHNVIRRIRTRPGEDFSLLDLAEESGLSLSRFKVKFKAETGFAPREFILRVKVEEAKKALAEKQLSVTDIAMDLGFNTSQYFATVFKRFTEQTPIEFRAKPSRLAEGEFLHNGSL
jgi:AraC-like DNA-binding protein